MINKIKHKLGKVYRQIGRIGYKDNNIYLIYTMGKVGSSSIYKSLKKKHPFAHNYQVHHLSKLWLQEILPQRPHKSSRANIPKGKEAIRAIESNPGKRIKIVTLTREPISRSISDLFQNWRRIFDDIEAVEIEDLKDHVESLDYDYAINWFDSEFFNFTNVDIYQLPFDKEKGYETYTMENLDILCIKLERFNSIPSSVLQEFLGTDLELLTANTSSNKKGKDRYKYLKKNVKINADKLEELYSSKYMHHFYTDSEIEMFKNKWIGS